MKRFKLLVIILYFFTALFSCKKDQVPLPAEPTKWEKIEGKYKVYDTLGVFLYKMEIKHISGVDTTGHSTDSLRFVNFDNQFNLTEIQSNQIVSNWPENYFFLGAHNPIKDKNGKRWRLLGLTNNIYNSLVGDTIKLRFDKTNILYYISDLTPYFSCVCIQYAVKQH